MGLDGSRLYQFHRPRRRRSGPSDRGLPRSRLAGSLQPRRRGGGQDLSSRECLVSSGVFRVGGRRLDLVLAVAGRDASERAPVDGQDVVAPRLLSVPLNPRQFVLRSAIYWSLQHCPTSSSVAAPEQPQPSTNERTLLCAASGLYVTRELREKNEMQIPHWRRGPDRDSEHNANAVRYHKSEEGARSRDQSASASHDGGRHAGSASPAAGGGMCSRPGPARGPSNNAPEPGLDPFAGRTNPAPDKGGVREQATKLGKQLRGRNSFRGALERQPAARDLRSRGRGIRTRPDALHRGPTEDKSSAANRPIVPSALDARPSPSLPQNSNEKENPFFPANDEGRNHPHGRLCGLGSGRPERGGVQVPGSAGKPPERGWKKGPCLSGVGRRADSGAKTSLASDAPAARSRSAAASSASPSASSAGGPASAMAEGNPARHSR
ncbi:hypothetical protein CDD83_2942 [Cordyceps sp. RAO-2017]|nr:hypothetical protein CDD83_2942 [Cordyceps sp. RAO-2017]